MGSNVGEGKNTKKYF